MVHRSFLVIFRCVVSFILVGTTAIDAFSLAKSKPNLYTCQESTNRCIGTSKNWNTQDPILYRKSRNLVPSSTALVLSTIPYQPYADSGPFSRLKEISDGAASSWKRISEVSKWRIAAISFISTIVMNRSFIDQNILQPLWNHLLSSPTSVPARVFRTDSYEWCLAIAAFTVIIHWYQYIDHQVQIANTRGIIHPYRKYRLQDRYLADKLRRRQQRRTLMADRSRNSDTNESSISMSSLDELHPSDVVVQQSKWHVGAYFFELWVYALPLLTWDILSPRRHRRRPQGKAQVPSCRN